MNEEPTAPFRLADLPAEIRNQIYRCILVHHRQPVKFGKHQGGPTLKDLAIVFTNRRIYSEAMPVFLSDNAFSITGTRTEHAWLRRMRPEGRSELRNVTLVVSECGYNHDFHLYNALSLCPQVHLTLEVRPGRLVEASGEGSLRRMHGYVHFEIPTSLDSICGVACGLGNSGSHAISQKQIASVLSQILLSLSQMVMLLWQHNSSSLNLSLFWCFHVERQTLTLKSAKICSSDFGSAPERDRSMSVS